MPDGSEPNFAHLVLHLAKYTGLLANIAEKMEHTSERADALVYAKGFYEKYFVGGQVQKTITMLDEMLYDHAKGLKELA